MRNLICIGLFIMVFCLSCEEKECCVQNLTDVVKIRWTGDYTVDGCGYFIDIRNTEYKPINEDVIKNKYLIIQDTIVNMHYFDLKKRNIVSCGFTQPSYPTIEILDIF